MHRITITFFTLILVTCLNLTARADDQNSPLAIARQLSDALETGNKDTVLNLLASDVLIYEGGGVESSAEEYANHHLPADMNYLSGLTKEIISQKVFEQGDLAIVTSVSQLTGTYRDKAINSSNTETLVLKRNDNHWKIIHIHWSSR